MTAFAVVGCNTGKRDKTPQTNAATVTSTQPTGTTPTTTTPVTTSNVTWSVPYVANPAVLDDSVFAIHALGGNEYLLGHTTGAVRRVDVSTTGSGTLEGSFGSISSITSANGNLYLGTSQPFFIGGNLGQVYVRDATGNWNLSLDHPLGGAVVVGMNDTLYAFASEFGQGASATVSVLSSSSTTWTQDFFTFPTAIVNKAVVFNNEVWAGGTTNSTTSGPARIWHGTTGNYVEETLPSTVGSNELEFVTSMVVAGNELVVGTAIYDTLAGFVTGGKVLSSPDGSTWSMVKTYANDAPTSLAVHQGALFVGLVTGQLETEDTTGTLVADTEGGGIPANQGVLAMSAESNSALLLGIRGNSGAELYRRETAGGTNSAQNVPTTPALTYQADIRPLLLSNMCTTCHSDPANAANAAFPLSANLTDDTADYAQVRQRLDFNQPDASLLLLKPSGQVMHQGGTLFQSNSATATTLTQWIQAQAPFN